MLSIVGDWAYQNAMAIFVFFLISLLVSRKYYKKGNYNALLMTISYPIR